MTYIDLANTAKTREDLPEPLATPIEAAEVLNCTVQNIINMMNDGSLPSIRLRRNRRIPVAALRALVTPK
jgi:excisionase family DNA binding protein